MLCIPRASKNCLAVIVFPRVTVAIISAAKELIKRSIASLFFFLSVDESDCKMCLRKKRSDCGGVLSFCLSSSSEGGLINSGKFLLCPTISSRRYNTSFLKSHLVDRN